MVSLYIKMTVPLSYLLLAFQVALIGGTLPPQGEDGMEAEDSMGVDSAPRAPHNAHTAHALCQEHVGELGTMLLACEQTSTPILLTILRYEQRYNYQALH